MYRRDLREKIVEALQDTPVILINGARQTGKSTLVKELLLSTHTYWTLDDLSVLSAIKKDPMGFVSNLSFPVILDEVQRAPEIFLPIKMIVDQKRTPGQFILTGSANVLMLPKLADSLAGRMEIHTLWPLSQGEITDTHGDIIENLFNMEKLYTTESLDLDSLIKRIMRGGYPEIQKRPTQNRQSEWFNSYIATILQKDIWDLSRIEGIVEFPALFNLLATRVGTLVNASEISRALGMSNTTLKRYFSLLEKIYFIYQLPSWSKNFTKRLVRAPKLYLNDTGLLTYLLGSDEEGLRQNPTILGHVLENFVVMELLKKSTWSRVPTNLYHYRTASGQEVDIILEARDSRVVAIEVKLSKTVQPSDFKGINVFEEETGKKFYRGIIFYMGDKVVPYGKNKHAIPLSFLWSH
jgi:predicted AAA+ superfamily ATPase